MLCLVSRSFASRVVGFNEFKLDIQKRYLDNIVLQTCDKNHGDHDEDLMFDYSSDEKLKLNSADKELLMYVTQFYPNLVQMDINLIDYRGPIEMFFAKLEVLKLGNATIDYTMISRVTALPKLRVLSLNRNLSSHQGFLDRKRFKGELYAMEMLESLELGSVDCVTFQSIVGCCTERLQDIYFKASHCIDINVLIDKCPGLRSVGVVGWVKQPQMRALVRKLGSQLQYLHYFPRTGCFVKVISELTKFDRCELRALDVYFTLTTKEQLQSFVLKHAGLRRLKLIKGRLHPERSLYSLCL